MKQANKAEKIILGIDPGTNVMGYGVIRVVGNKAQLVVMGIIDMRKESDPYLRLGKIFERVTGIIDEYLPDEMAIEAPFFGKNVQSMLKLGRAQGVAIAAAIHHDVPIHEYAPLKIKMAITGQGQASKEQVAGMLQRMLKISDNDMPKFMDATDRKSVRRTRSCLLPLSADGKTRDRRATLLQLERLCHTQQRQGFDNRQHTNRPSDQTPGSSQETLILDRNANNYQD